MPVMTSPPAATFEISHPLGFGVESRLLVQSFERISGHLAGKTTFPFLLESDDLEVQHVRTPAKAEVLLKARFFSMGKGMPRPLRVEDSD